MLSFRALPRLAAASSFSSSSSLVQRPLRSLPLRTFASSSYPPSTANNKGNYAANQVPISTTANPEPNRASGFASQTVKVSETLKDAYSGLKERVMSTAAGVMDSSKTVMEKGKEAMEMGKGAMETGKEKMASMAGSMAGSVNQKIEKLETKFEQGGLGPVTGDDSSIAPGKGFGSTPSSGVKDAAMGGENSDFERKQGPGVSMQENSETGHVSVRPIDSGASSSSASSSKSNMKSGNSSAAVETQQAETGDRDVPQYGVMKPVDSASASKRQGVQSSSDMSLGADRAAAQREGGLSANDTAVDHAAQAQRKQGMSSSELLGTDAIRGKDSERAAQAPKRQ